MLARENFQSLWEDFVFKVLYPVGEKFTVGVGGGRLIQFDGNFGCVQFDDAFHFNIAARAFLESTPPFPGVTELLDQVDVLIDGPYIARMNDNVGLRGSKNQKIHYLTDRLRNYDLENQPRTAEVHLLHGQAMMVGVPPTRLGEAFNQAVDQAQKMEMELLRYERV